MERLLFVWFYLCLVRYGILEACAYGDQVKYVSENYGMADPYGDPRYSSTIAAKEGYRVFTNAPGKGLKETLSVTHADGLYVSGEKVATVRELQALISSQEAIMTRQEASIHALAMEVDLLKAQVTNLTVLAVQPPTCSSPKMQLSYNGTSWVCACISGWGGEGCASRLSSCKDVVPPIDGTYNIAGNPDVFCDFTTSGNGVWTVPVIQADTQQINSLQRFRTFCSSKGFPHAGKGLDNQDAWLAQKWMLWQTNHSIKLSGWPSDQPVLAMPIFQVNGVFYQINDGSTVAQIPRNIRGDRCDVGTTQIFCGYYFSDGWNDSNRSEFPDPEDWQYGLGSYHVSCMWYDVLG